MVRMAIGTCAVTTFALDFTTGDDVGQKSEYRSDGQQSVTPGAWEKPHGQPEIRRDTATPTVKQGRVPSVNLVGNCLHCSWNYRRDGSEPAAFDR